MTKLEIARKSFEDTIWMAIRYAHGRHTYAPHTVRDAVKSYKAAFPDFKLKHDVTIQPKEGELSGIECQSDYLNDLFD